MTIFCIGRNYSEHAKELNNPIPAEPVVFMKPSTALLIDNKPFYYPEFTKDLHHELELVYKIAKPGKKINKEKAWDHVSHVTVGIDFTARDIQQRCKEKSLPWEIAKAFDHSAVIGEWQPLSHENSALEFFLEKNGTEVQRGLSSDMIFKLPEIISFLSSYFKLCTGDIIFTGTPPGVGAVQIGDELKGYLQDKQMFYCQIK